jgi:AcrR family transcriptional regulator
MNAHRQDGAGRRGSERQAARAAGASTAERLLPEAAKLFRERGYAASSTRELAERLNLNKASLYYHVESKEDLLYEICSKSLRDVIASAEAVIERETSPKARLEGLIRSHITAITADIDMHATMLLELRSLSPGRRHDVMQLRNFYEALVEHEISDAQHAGDLRSDCDARSLALLLFNLLNWTITWYRSDGDLDPNELIDMSLRIFLEGAGGPR